MKIKHLSITLLMLLGVLSCLQAQTYGQLWKQVEVAENMGKPQTVIQLTTDIFRKAEQEKNSPQMLKAYTERMHYRAVLAPNDLYSDLIKLKKWVEATENPLDRAVLHSLLAGMYANYAMEHRDNLHNHIDVDDDDPQIPVEAWSGQMLVRLILKHTREALRDKELLLETSTQAYTPFVIRGETSRYYGHDLYHLLACRTIEALKGARYIAMEAIVNKEIPAMYQSMLDTYQARGNDEASALIALEFLEWRWQRGEFSSRDYRTRPSFKQERYVLELDKLIDRYRSKPVTAETYLCKAQLAIVRSERLLALQLCEEAMALYPGYERIDALKEVRQEILSPTLRISHDKVFYPEAELKLSVNHRNLDGFQVMFYRVNLPEVPSKEPELNDVFYRKHTTRLSTQHVLLKRPSDYLRKDTTLTLTTPTEGMYVMRFIPDGKGAPVVESFVYISRLMVITRALPKEQFEVRILDRRNGHPVPEARVTIYSEDGGQEELAAVGATGTIRIPCRKGIKFVRAWKGNDRSMPYGNIQKSYIGASEDEEDEEDEPEESITLLTDRPLYRAGQTVYVKGVAAMLRFDTAQVIPHRKYVITLSDAALQEVAQKEVITNEFGSFTADFTLPAGVNGEYALDVLNERRWIRVEDYKRPLYDIRFDKLAGAYSLGDSVQLTGKVRMFNGAAVQSVPIQYTIGRSAVGEIGDSRRWYEVIVSGTTGLSDEGMFSIPLVLAEKEGTELPYYNFRVDVKVTSVTGETQTASFNQGVGKRSLMLGTDLKYKICKDQPIQATFKAANLNDQPQEVEGTFRLYSAMDEKTKTTAKEAVRTGTFVSNREMILSDWQSLPSGGYRLVLSACDAQGREVIYKERFILFSEWDTRPLEKTELQQYEINTDFDANHPAVFTLAVPFTDTYLMMSVVGPDSILEEKTFVLTDSTLRFEIPYKEAYGNKSLVAFTLVKDGRLVEKQVRLQKRVSDKGLRFQWLAFRDKLRSGQQEEWRLAIRTPQGTPADAEMLALMYDASLDKFWNRRRGQDWDLYYPSGNVPSVAWSSSYLHNSYLVCEFPYSLFKAPEWKYDYFSVREQQKDFSEPLRSRGASQIRHADEGDFIYSMEDPHSNRMEYKTVSEENVSSDVRTNFSETAFFFPQLRTNEQGEIAFAFTMPESLTRWNFQGFAHTRGMLTGTLADNVTTSKEFMLTPNLPRFVRVGDQAAIAASVVNLTGKPVDGTVAFTLFDPVTEKVIDTQKQPFAVVAGQTTAVTFRFAVTEEYQLLGCRMVADGGTFSDGEQHLLPVLSNKERLTESVALPLRGNETRTFPLNALFNNRSRTAGNRRLTVEFTTHPAWYALQALPSLNLSETKNTLSCMTAYYANTLAAYIMNSQPRIKAVIDSWKLQGGTKESFLSNLQKNQEVKNILLTESPWMMEAKDEQQQMQRISTLFDLTNIASQRSMAMKRLKKLQLSDGSFPWFEGMGSSSWVTLSVAKLCARLPELTGQPLDKEMTEMCNKAMNCLSKEIWKEYYELVKMGKAGKPVPRISGKAVDYLYVLALSGRKTNTTGFLKSTLNHAVDNLNRLSVEEKAKLALVFDKLGRKPQADALLASLREYLTKDEDRGLYFAFKEDPYTWNGQLIPAHVYVMEAFHRVEKDSLTVDEMKRWLLKQKQMQQWNSPVATADAVYALLCLGTNPIDGQGSAHIKLAGRVMDTQKNAPVGLGLLRESFTDKKTVEAKEITVSNQQPGIGWGAVYAQYEEATDRVQQHGNELNVDKQLYIEQGTGNERRLQPVTPQMVLKVGDKVISRLILRTDRPMEFVQLKDQRGACFEPNEVLSGYRWTNGFGFYVDVKDASTHFFFDGLGKGTFILEYGYHVARPGTYNEGLATVQCAYAPEYASHSASVVVTIE